MFCRISFRNAPYGDGAGWSVDYPRADMNLSIRFSELTSALVSRDGRSRTTSSSASPIRCCSVARS